ncbi:MAG: oligopeptidase B, partial [Glaciecola sp.]
PRGGGEVQVLFDGNLESEGHDYFRVSQVDTSNDHAIVAYGLDTKGSEYFTMRFRDPVTGVELDDVLVDTSGYVVWAADDRTVFYVVQDDNHRPVAVLRHDMGTPQDQDVEVYREQDPGFFVDVGLTHDRSLVVIGAHDHQSGEQWIIGADDPTSAPRLVAPREADLEYDIDRDGDRLIILTNADGAEDFKLVSVPLATPGREYWVDLVGHREGTLVEGFGVLSGHLVRSETVDALPRIVVRDLADGEEHVVNFAEEAYDLGLSLGAEYDTSAIRFSYSSPTTPGQVWDYDVASRERVMRKQLEIPSGHDPADYVTRRMMATAADGEQVPVTILHRAGLTLDGSAPCLLYGYGSYGMSMPAGFSTNRLSLVDRGFVYAIAHIRGGKERGYRWYREGRREHKPNTFTDFVAAGEALVAEGYTSEGRIAAHGGSAGGLLMGAVANLAPSLFGAIVAEVPFVDVLTTMLDDTLPLTPPEWPEWGNPIEDAEAFAWIKAYSPYDNVSAQDYPAMWIEGGLTDPRVTYWEPAKWAARLRATRTNPDQLLCCKINMGAGHGGKSGRFQALEELAEKYTFVLLALGMA